MKVIKYANYWYVTLMQTPRKHEILNVHLKENFIIKTCHTSEYVHVPCMDMPSWLCHANEYDTFVMNMSP